ncbi:cytochrome P450 monooxygenase [Ilyonectria robusta]|uniref:cytochrome P450 monooxygenase n=1 Tax=Ilyonectria robusta TaxID=1079257 RepID=UPI001E8CB1E7|nr:cytochrome P450 monooxygenase [Ilyonectria robusta]KAH8706430.1 cytochrome P450 monooxygenase [Ilyonectria robusta]
MPDSIVTGVQPLLVLYFALALVVVYIFGQGLYNLYLHALGTIPGPKLAAFSRLYEFWFDVIQDGQYLWEIGRMHNKYGPIVRIGPNVIYIRDLSYYSTIYAGGSRIVDKDALTVGSFSMPSSSIATIDHNLHRARRGYLNQYFSKRSVVSLEPIIHERVDKLCQRLERFMSTGETVSLDRAFSALTGDIICRKLYGSHFDFLDIPDFRIFATEAVTAISSFVHLARFSPTRTFLLILTGYTLLQQDIKTQINIASNKEKGEQVDSVMLSTLIDSHVPPAERSVSRLVDEGTAILLAGTETTARALSIAMFYLLDQKECLTKLRQELIALPAHEINWFPLSLLEPLPYLNGVVNEALRLSFGPIGPLPRVSPKQHLQYGEYLIPAGTPVSQSTYYVHTDPSIFPEPFNFDPERWIKATESGINLQKYLVSFTKGSRQCIGIQMAYAEMYTTLARIVSSFDMDLFETTKEDVTVHCERVLAYPKQPRFGTAAIGQVKVKVTGKRSV